MWDFNFSGSKMADERNFRSTYYEKVGFKSVEEKRSLEILLKDKHLDLSKLKQFCLRFSVPSAYRNLVWKLLLGVIPVYVNCQSFVMDQRKEEYSNLIHALKVMRVTNNDTPKQQVFMAAYLLQSGNLRFEANLKSENKSFLAISEALIFFFDNEVDAFWLARSFYDNIVLKFENDFVKLSEKTFLLLEKEDFQLYKHLCNVDILENLPLEDWFQCCFAGVISNVALGKIWDKICGGSYKLLIYVAVVIITSLKIRILKCKDLSSVVELINNISDDVADVIANKSIELWQQHGSPLTIYDKPKP